MPFTLDPRLHADSIPLAETQECLILLMNDQRFIWLTLVPKFANMSELYQLPDKARHAINEQSNLLMKMLMAAFNGDSANVAALGNVVSQLHIHHVVRFKNDACWPGPIWGQGQMQAYSPERLEGVLDTLLPVVETMIKQFNE